MRSMKSTFAEFPLERKVLLIVLLLVLVISLGVIVWDAVSERIFSIASSTANLNETLETFQEKYSELIKERNRIGIYSRDELEDIAHRIDDLEDHYFQQHEEFSIGEFGEVVKGFANRSRVTVNQIRDLQGGFQFTLEGSIEGLLDFMHRIEEYEYRISTPFFSLNSNPEGSYRLSIECYPVFLPED